MKTVVENIDVRTDRPYSVFTVKKRPIVNEEGQGRSCFYDYGASSSVEFTGFVNTGDISFIDEIGK